MPLRSPTFNALFSLMSEMQSPLTIVETGTIRNHLEKYAFGDGHSTLQFTKYVSDFGGEFYSVDIDPIAVVVSTMVCTREYPSAMDKVNIIESDSVAFLKSFDKPIDVLYLDSANDAELILNEAKAALGHLHSESCILIDDCFNENHYHVEKGSLVIPFLEENGWVMEANEYQALFIHKDRF
ncbi:MAG: hypothetical protein CMA77_05460 [Euryarchaeota archaeon]|nr:hypothetical protein [Euryarchaeota archaeon]